jgi:hypothetical protein
LSYTRRGIEHAAKKIDSGDGEVSVVTYGILSFRDFEERIEALKAELDEILRNARLARDEKARQIIRQSQSAIRARTMKEVSSPSVSFSLQRSALPLPSGTLP